MIEYNIRKTFSAIVFCGCLAIFSQALAQKSTETKTITEETEISSEDLKTEETKQPLPTYTWVDFLTNKDCRPLIKELATRSEYNALYHNLRISCLDEKPMAWNYLLNTFRNEKRQLLFHQMLKSNDSYTKYLYIVPHLLFDIQNTKPAGNLPGAIMDRIEQTIIDHQMDNILPLIDKLPDSWKDELKNTQVLTKRLIELKDQLDSLNESEQGVQND